MNLFAQRRADPRRAETVAGRRFLEALRQSHKDEDESTAPKVETVRTASIGFGAKPKNDDVTDLKRKRMTLRASLEELLVEYLRGVAPDGDDENQSRVKRSMNSVENNDFNHQNDYENRRESNSDADIVNNSNVREENRIRSDYTAEIPNEHIEFEDDRANRTTNTSRSVCAEQRQRVTQLDRNELNAAIQNVSEHEHNIRRMLNYRYVRMSE